MPLCNGGPCSAHSPRARALSCPQYKYGSHSSSSMKLHPHPFLPSKNEPTMLKSVILLAALCYAQVTLAVYQIWIENNDNSKHRYLSVPEGSRWCYCLSKTQTAIIDDNGGGNVKLFSSSDCTGNFASGTKKTTYNSQWVNSVSFGEDGISSTWGGGKSCSLY
ncbi:MAG: hypothetical protein JOS17DRAFT_734393 [Linnemannia elongata]|nr:MAG: hypothetical protein JOS17DRAFT_734393 [Linnemannia elongata]